MSAVNAIKTGLRKSFIFKGRASRSEYWWMFGFSMVSVFIFMQVAMNVTGASALSGTFEVTPENPLTEVFMSVFELSTMVFCLLMLAVVARRFQDHGWSGKWFRWMMIMTILTFVFFTYAAARSFFMGQMFLSATPPFTFFFVFIPYASIIWTFWIGFVRPDPHTNTYGPNPNEVSND